MKLSTEINQTDMNHICGALLIFVSGMLLQSEKLIGVPILILGSILSLIRQENERM